MKIGSPRLRAFLRIHNRVAIDTSIFIYFVEGNLKYLALTSEIMEWLENPAHSAVTSTLTMTEVLTKPFADHDIIRVDQYYGLLSTYPNLEWIAPDLQITALAAEYRAQYRMRTPDAIQAATAVRAVAQGFVSNDPVFKRVTSFETLLFDDLL
jgi:predicted nucleic acid-binding protein